MKTMIIAVALLSSSLFSGEMSIDTYRRLRAALAAAQGAVPGAAAAFAADARQSENEVMDAVSSGQVIQRELAAHCLSFSGQKDKAVGLLLVLVADVDDGVRQAACEALGRRRDAKAVEPLLKALSEDDAAFVRADAASALGEIMDERALPALAKSLTDDGKPHVRAFCAMALARFSKTNESIVAMLANAMEKENDPLVKSTIANLLANMLGVKPRQEDGPDPAKSLKDLSEKMKGLEEKLRSDRHDDAVQADGKGIDDELSSLIEGLEKSQQQQQKKNEKQDQQQRQKQKEERMASMSPMPRSQLPQATPAGPTQEAAQVSGKQSGWAKLPKSQRDEIMQAYASDVPEKWRKRLEAYYLSIAAEEVKRR